MQNSSELPWGPSVTTAGQGLEQALACSVLRLPELEAGAEQVGKALSGERNEKVMVGCKIKLIRQENEEGIGACPSRRPAAFGLGGGLAAFLRVQRGKEERDGAKQKNCLCTASGCGGNSRFADKGLLKAQKCSCSETFLLLFGSLSPVV